MGRRLGFSAYIGLRVVGMEAVAAWTAAVMLVVEGEGRGKARMVVGRRTRERRRDVGSILLGCYI